MTVPHNSEVASVRVAVMENTPEGWQARARREAAAILDDYGLVPAFNRDALVGLLAVSWLQGFNLGAHDTLTKAEAAFERVRDAL